MQHMPELSASLNPSLPEVLASTADWARAEEDYWAAELDRLEPIYLIEKPETILISTGPYGDLPMAAQRRLLRRAIERVRGSLRAIDFRHVEAIRAMMATREGSGRIQLPGLDVYRSFDWLRLTPFGIDSRLERDFEAPVVVPGRTVVPERHLTIEMELTDKPSVYNKEVQALDWERCAGSLSSVRLMVRNWRPGDQYQPQGRTTAEKIKTLFQEYRIPLWERRSWPVIVQAGDVQAGDVQAGDVQAGDFETRDVHANGVRADTIVWSRQFGVASKFAAGPESGKILTISEVTESKPRNVTSMLMGSARGNQFRQPDEPGADV
jgi:tRNA(Ile)-lysidine synthase